MCEDTATNEIYTLSLLEALPPSPRKTKRVLWLPALLILVCSYGFTGPAHALDGGKLQIAVEAAHAQFKSDRESTRLNSVTWPLRMPASAGKKKV